MTQPSVRSPATIVSLDLHGYSRLTEQDEIGTHRALMTCMRSLLEPVVQGRGGLVAKFTGDGALLHFSEATDAVLAMIRFQREVQASEAGFPQSRRLQFRIGIHRAPTIFDKGDVFGHGVNLAVRLQEIGEPGTICLSDVVFKQLGTDIAKQFGWLGKRRFKNIEERFDIFCWRMDGHQPSFRAQHVGALIAAVLFANMVLPSAALNSIQGEKSVLDNLLSMQPVEESQRRGSNDVIFPENYKLDVASVLSAAGSRTVSHRGLPGGPLNTDVKTTLDAPERSLENRQEIAEDAYFQALALYGRHTPEAFARAIGELDEALRFDPAYGEAHALLAAVYWSGAQNRWQLGLGLSRADMLRRTNHHLSRVRISAPFVSMVISEMLTEAGRHDQAIETAERAVMRDPLRAVSHFAKGRALLFAGRPFAAEVSIRDAIRLDPYASRYLFGLALVQFSLDRFDHAERTLARAISRNDDNDWTHLLMAATQGHLGLKSDAREAIGRFDRLSLVRRGWFASQIPYVHRWPFQDDADRARLHRGMVLAGIPEVSR